jgi:hypothetical protein
MVNGTEALTLALSQRERGFTKPVMNFISLGSSVPSPSGEG